MGRIVTGQSEVRTYFFTVRIADRGADILVRHIDLFRRSVQIVQQSHPFAIDAAVVLPAMTQMIWTLPPRDQDFPQRWQSIKATFRNHLPKAVRRQYRGHDNHLWQRRFWERPIFSTEELHVYMQEIRHAPVRAGLVKDPGKWPYSSFSERFGTEMAS